MSMIGNFRRLSEFEYARLLAQPDEIEGFLYPDEGDDNDEGPSDELDVDKAWHAIHFLLTGTAWDGDGPLAFICCGGTTVGDDVGYGPARGFSTAEVQAIASALADITPEQLRQRFDPRAMTAADIYPAIWDRPQEKYDAIGYVLTYYEELRQFVGGAAERGMAMLVYLN